MYSFTPEWSEARGVKCLAQGVNDTPSTQQCPSDDMRVTSYFSDNHAPSEPWTRTTGSGSFAKRYALTFVPRPPRCLFILFIKKIIITFFRKCLLSIVAMLTSVGGWLTSLILMIRITPGYLAALTGKTHSLPFNPFDADMFVYKSRNKRVLLI